MAAISFGLFSYYPRSVFAAQTGSNRSGDFLSQLLGGAEALSASPIPAGSFLNPIGTGVGSSNNERTSIEQLRTQLLNLRDAVSAAQQGRPGSAQTGAGGTR